MAHRRQSDQGAGRGGHKNQKKQKRGNNGGGGRHSFGGIGMHDDDRDNGGLDEFMSGLGVGATSRVQGGGKKKVRKRALDGGGHVVASMPALFVICIFQVAMTTPHSSHSLCL